MGPGACAMTLEKLLGKPLLRSGERDHAAPPDSEKEPPLPLCRRPLPLRVQGCEPGSPPGVPNSASRSKRRQSLLEEAEQTEACLAPVVTEAGLWQ